MQQQGFSSEEQTFQMDLSHQTTPVPKVWWQGRILIVHYIAMENEMFNSGGYV